MRLRQAAILYLAALLIFGGLSLIFSSQPVLYILLTAILLSLLFTGFITVKRLESGLRQEAESLLPQMQAMIEINSIVRLRAPLPPLGGWAIAADLLPFFEPIRNWKTEFYTTAS
jgi:hypothetical protein